jgi:hypothetical protein
MPRAIGSCSPSPWPVLRQEKGRERRERFRICGAGAQPSGRERFRLARATTNGGREHGLGPNELDWRAGGTGACGHTDTAVAVCGTACAACEQLRALVTRRSQLGEKAALPFFDQWPLG